MFYCEPCRVKNDWPESIFKSVGKCECCGKNEACHDRPSSTLPPVKRAIPQAARRQHGSAAQGVPAFDHNADCDPTVTRCPRCKNPHHSCDRGSKAQAVDGDAFIALFESVISQDPAAFSKVGETTYQVTRTELIELATRLAAPPVADADADSLAEPKNGAQWKVHWWNESMRLMLPADSCISHINHFRNGTMVITIKRNAAAIDAAKAKGAEGAAE